MAVSSKLTIIRSRHTLFKQMKDCKSAQL